MSCLFICPHIVYNQILMADYSITAFPMIVFSLIASIYIFNGAFFRFRTQLTLCIALIIVSLTTFLSIIDNSIILSLHVLFTSFLSLPILNLLLCILISLIVETIILAWTRPIALYVIIIVSSYLLSITIADVVKITDILFLLIVFAISNVVIFLLYSWKKDELCIISSLLGGAFVLSSLFSAFYYFPLSIHISLGIVLLISGFFVQRHTLIEIRKKEKR